jgi:NADPH:quinone reductase-like Zn-dependent oxidoreductase
MMKAAFLTKRPEIGAVPDHIQVGDIPLPVISGENLKSHQVLVDVQAACINIDDLHAQEGSFVGGIPFLQAPTPTPEKPCVPGCDFAGVVKAVGSKVTKLKVGDAVCGVSPPNEQGTWSQQLVANQDATLAIPASNSSFSFADWASLIMPAFVITDMFKQGAVNDIAAKDESRSSGTATSLRCLVVGASGGLGSFLTQLLSAQPNVHVTGVCSSKNIELVRGLGADDVFDYTKGSLTELLEKSKLPKFDRVFDVVGGHDIEEEAYQSLLVTNGRFVTAVGPYKFVGDSVMSYWAQFKWIYHILLSPPLFNILYRGRKPSYHMALPYAPSEEMLRPVQDAKIRPVIERLVPFEKDAIAEAVKLVQSHRVRG